MDENKTERFIRWGEVDHKLASLKTTELALDMGDIIKKEKNRIRFENRMNQNAGAVPSLSLQMQKEQTEEYVRRTCQVYRDVCVAQGGRISAEAIRAVFQHAIVTLFAARINGVRADLVMEACRTGANRTQLHALLESFTQEMERLKSRWSRKLEAEALECEHAERARAKTALRGEEQRIASRLATNPSSVAHAPTPRNEQEVAAEPEIMAFQRRGDKTIAVDGYSHEAILETYTRFIVHMKEIKAVIRSSKGKVTVADLEQRFSTTTLGNAADYGDFEIWIDDFKNGGPKERSAGFGNHTISFLSRKTGLTVETLKTYMKKARSNRKSPTIP